MRPVGQARLPDPPFAGPCPTRPRRATMRSMEPEQPTEDWIAGTTFEAFAEVGEEPVVVALDGIDFGTENYA